MIRVYISLLVFLFSLSACNSFTEDSQQKKIFTNLSRIHYALDFPYSKESLDNCIENNYKPCLENFEQARLAKQQLFSKSPEDALSTTLATIDRECSKLTLGNENLCSGAVTALGFFKSVQDDKQIMLFLSNASVMTLKRIFEMNLNWLYTRNDKTQWEKWVDDSSLDAVRKKGLINILNDAMPDEFAIDLL